MKIFFLVFIFNTSLLCIANAQWQYVNNIPTLNNLNYVYFPCVDTGYAVGANGTIIKTNDSGNTWVSQSSNTNNTLRSIHFVNSSIGWIVGDSGTILKTSNGGILWNTQIFNVWSYRSVYLINADTCFVVGGDNNFGKIIKTTDGGNNWAINYTTNNQYQILYSVYFKSKDTGFVAGFDTIYLTANGGSTWLPIQCGISHDAFYSICFPSSNIGYALGLDGQLIKTTDGGNSWILKQNNLAYVTFSMYFTGIDTGYVVGNNYEIVMGNFLGSVILKTTDGGNTFNTLSNIASSKVLNSIFFTNANTGYIVGEQGTILKTTNAGNTWVKYNENIQNEYLNIYPNPSKNVVIISFSDNLILLKTATLTISDLNGRQFINQQISSEKTEVNISSLSEGVYIVKVFCKENVFVKKLIIK